jgi:ribosomal-protein-alanine N-acetyltransferase
MEIFGHSSLEQLETEHKRHSKGMTTFNMSFLFFQLIEKESGSPIGWCGYHTWMTFHRRAEIFYTLNDDAHKRKGYMTEALKEVIRYGFEEMDLNRIEAIAATYNEPSLKLIHNSGFVKEGLMREHYNVDGILEDDSLFSLLRSEYRAKN